jgi:hypothetical protein
MPAFDDVELFGVRSAVIVDITERVLDKADGVDEQRSPL